MSIEMTIKKFYENHPYIATALGASALYAVGTRTAEEVMAHPIPYVLGMLTLGGLALTNYLSQREMARSFHIITDEDEVRSALRPVAERPDAQRLIGDDYIVVSPEAARESEKIILSQRPTKAQKASVCRIWHVSPEQVSNLWVFFPLAAQAPDRMVDFVNIVKSSGLLFSSVRAG